MSFFRYPGGKGKLVGAITRRVLADLTADGLEYREPFFGGGRVCFEVLAHNKPLQASLGVPQVRAIWMNDLDVGVACLWTSVLRYPGPFAARVRAFEPSVAAFDAFRAELLARPPRPQDADAVVDLGFKKLAVHQMSYSGLGTQSGGPLGGPDQGAARYKVDCRWSPDYLCRKVGALHKVLRGVCVRQDCCTSVDFEEVLSDTTTRVVSYIDPPYYEKGPELYQESLAPADHRRLADVLRCTPHAWLLSYDDCPQVRALYEGWACVQEVPVSYSINGVRGRRELLIAPRSGSSVP